MTLTLKVLAVLGLHCCTWSISGWGQWGLLSSRGVWASHSTPSFITAWKWAFSWCLLSLSSSHSFLFFASIFYGLLVRLDLCNITWVSSAFKRNIQILAFCLEASPLSPFSLIHFPSLPFTSYLRLLLDFCLGSCGIKSSYVENHTLFKNWLFGKLVTWLCFQAKCCLGFCWNLTSTSNILWMLLSWWQMAGFIDISLTYTWQKCFSDHLDSNPILKIW